MGGRGGGSATFLNFSHIIPFFSDRVPKNVHFIFTDVRDGMAYLDDVSIRRVLYVCLDTRGELVE